MSLGLWPKTKSTAGDPYDDRSKEPDAKPIEPESAPSTRLSLFKWVFFIAAIIYVLLSYFHAPILIQLGKYLVVQHSIEKSDLIVCLAGGEVERGLASADLFARGLAPRVFIARETIPDGLEMLKQRGIAYPEGIDRMTMILKGLGVPESALIRSEQPVESTFQEAERVGAVVTDGKYRSLILVTSPTHSRRAWLTFRKAIPDKEVRITVMPTPYSKFRAEDWWKTRKYVREVILEYQKLIYYKARELL
ncbi:MAG: hypothetical protein H6Q48_2814 [Deltaproteobacteria bacterium]|nr:hypothetical protein [Deltaproteobacteria bacterium]